MRSLVSDLIPEYNKKLQFFFKETLAYVMEPPHSPLSPSISHPPTSPLCSGTTSPCVHH